MKKNPGTNSSTIWEQFGIWKKSWEPTRQQYWNQFGKYMKKKIRGTNYSTVQEPIWYMKRDPRNQIVNNMGTNSVYEKRSREPTLQQYGNQFGIWYMEKILGTNLSTIWELIR